MPKKRQPIPYNSLIADAVSEIETFISECEEARDQLESVEFPGMFG